MDIKDIVFDSDTYRTRGQGDGVGQNEPGEIGFQGRLEFDNMGVQVFFGVQRQGQAGDMEIGQHNLPEKPQQVSEKTGDFFEGGTQFLGVAFKQQVMGQPGHQTAGKHPHAQVKQIEFSGQCHPKGEHDEKSEYRRHNPYFSFIVKNRPTMGVSENFVHVSISVGISSSASQCRRLRVNAKPIADSFRYTGR